MKSEYTLPRRDLVKLSAAGLLSGLSVPWFESLAEAGVKRPGPLAPGWVRGETGGVVKTLVIRSARDGATLEIRSEGRYRWLVLAACDE